MNSIPSLTKAQMLEVERLATSEFGLQFIQIAENAGRNLADLANQFAGGVQDVPIVVLAGHNTTGSGGLVAARHLINRGAAVQIFLTESPESFKGLPAEQLNLLLNMGAAVSYGDEGWELPPADLVIDALIGYALCGDPTGSVARLIGLANSHAAPILSLDTPSGFDLETGQPGFPCIRAQATITLALPKTGLLSAEAQPYVGDLYLADISIPEALYARLGLEVGPIFAEGAIRRYEP